jgi:small subunit ribosomal protein S17
MTKTKKQIAKQGYRNIGIPATPPGKRCTDRGCPWHSPISVRGWVFVGKVVKTKAAKTAIVEWGYPHYLWKYERYERRHSHIAAHNPGCISASVGDIVRVAECRPLSKTKAFVIIEKIPGIADMREALALAAPRPERRKAKPAEELRRLGP